jgi:hypothetical protein
LPRVTRSATTALVGRTVQAERTAGFRPRSLQNCRSALGQLRPFNIYSGDFRGCPQTSGYLLLQDVRAPRQTAPHAAQWPGFTAMSGSPARLPPCQQGMERSRSPRTIPWPHDGPAVQHGRDVSHRSMSLGARLQQNRHNVRRIGPGASPGRGTGRRLSRSRLTTAAAMVCAALADCVSAQRYWLVTCGGPERLTLQSPQGGGAAG